MDRGFRGYVPAYHDYLYLGREEAERRYNILYEWYEVERRHERFQAVYRRLARRTRLRGYIPGTREWRRRDAMDRRFARDVALGKRVFI